MSHNNKEYALAFAQFLPSMVKLNELQKMTENLDSELAESQKMMKDIRTMFDTAAAVNNTQPDNNNKSDINIVKAEDMSKLLDTSAPKLLMADMPNMAENTVEDLDDVIATMKSYADNLRKKVVLSTQSARNDRREFENLDLTKYAASFEEFGKRLTNIKLNKDPVNNRNEELEAKLTQLCQDVTLFSQMVKTKTAISESNKSWSDNAQESNALYYDDIINKLLSSINEVTYLLKNQN